MRLGLVGMLVAAACTRPAPSPPAPAPLPTEPVARAQALLARDATVGELTAAYDAAARAAPKNADVQFRVGVLAQLRGDPVRAAKAYRQAIRLDPRHAGASNNLGTLALAQRRTGDAAVDFARAAALRPENPVPLANLAMISAKIGETADALDLLLRAQALLAKTNPPVAAWIVGIQRSLDAVSREVPYPKRLESRVEPRTGFVLLSY